MSVTLASPATSGASSAVNPVLKQQAKDLEGVFLNTLMKEMFASIKTDDESFGGGFGEETWRGMQAEQFANAVADSGGVGLADQLLGDLVRLQEASQPGNAAPGNPASLSALMGGYR